MGFALDILGLSLQSYCLQEAWLSGLCREAGLLLMPESQPAAWAFLLRAQLSHLLLQDKKGRFEEGPRGTKWLLGPTVDVPLSSFHTGNRATPLF